MTISDQSHNSQHSRYILVISKCCVRENMKPSWEEINIIDDNDRVQAGGNIQNTGM